MKKSNLITFISAYIVCVVGILFFTYVCIKDCHEAFVIMCSLTAVNILGVGVGVLITKQKHLVSMVILGVVGAFLSCIGGATIYYLIYDAMGLPWVM